MKYYYTIPLDTRSLIEKRPHSLCDLKESLRMNINLIIKTHCGENRFDNSYGCLIWHRDYSTVTNVSNWKDELKSFMAEAININEPRLKEIKVSLDMEDAEFSERFRDQPIRLKKKITIQVTGVIKHLNEPFEHIEYLFFSPLSIG